MKTDDYRDLFTPVEYIPSTQPMPALEDEEKPIGRHASPYPPQGPRWMRWTWPIAAAAVIAVCLVWARGTSEIRMDTKAPAEEPSRPAPETRTVTAPPRPAVTVTVHAEPLPRVTVTQTVRVPLPQVTVTRTVTAEPRPAVTVTQTITTPAESEEDQ